MSLSPTRSNDEMEQLLRRTYSVVAARTTVESRAIGNEATVAPIDTSRANRWPILLAAAAVLGVLVGGLLILSSRLENRPAGRGSPVHLAPGWIPRMAGPDGDRPLFPLTELVTTDDGYDRLVYATDSASVTLERFTSGGDLPAGDDVVVRGALGRRSASSLHWIEPGGVRVDVSWEGAVPADLIGTFVDGLLAFDDDLWAEMVDHGGFRPADDISNPLATFRIAADDPFDVTLVGSLHAGASLRSGPNGFSLPFRGCRTQIDEQIEDLRDRGDRPGPIGYLVLAPGAPESVEAIADGRRIEVEMTSLEPTVDASVGGFVLDDRLIGDDLPIIACREEDS